jgi:homoserine dehydrogenase
VGVLVLINVCILGNGTVGSGVVELLNKNKEYIRKRTGEDVRISKILVKDVNKHSKEKYLDLITNDIDEIRNSDVDIIVEAIGGLYPAYDYIKEFLQKDKHVVTANKDVIAKYGEELSLIADGHGVSLRFEASVAGGIPILKPLQECLAGNDIQCFYAILNGTTNFILSKMFNEGMKYEKALEIAQELGFAEANPDSDVLGYDSARKLSILSTISYDRRVDWEQLYTEGITEIDELDMLCAKKAGYTIKLLAVSAREGEGIYASVRPAFVPLVGKLGNVNDEYNGILLEGDAVGQMFFCGKGAGKLPTASAVLGDIFDVIENKRQKSMFIEESKAQIITKWPKASNWFIRVRSENAKAFLYLANQRLKNLRVIYNGEGVDEIAAFIIKAENENTLDSALESLYKIISVKSVDKTIILDI